MKITSFLLVVFALALQGCSWIERFFIVNHTASPVTIEVKLVESPRGFTIFSSSQLYSYPAPKNKVSCDKPTEIQPTRLSPYHYSVELPANTALEIGRLFNDRYEKQDQYFINDRTFNLTEIRITVGGKETVIGRQAFDAHFKKSGNNICLYLK
jgi:hypothetical protein